MRNFHKYSLLAGAVLVAASAAYTLSLLVPLAAPQVLTDGPGAQVLDVNATAKIKLVRMSNGGATHGRLVSVYSDGWADDAHPDGHIVYDVKARTERPARDIFVRYSDDDGVTWSDATNISNTAAQFSSMTMWHGEETTPAPFYGDSGKPNIFNNGNMVAVTWVDKYCATEQQKSVNYVVLDSREIPYSCAYIARSKNGGTSFMPAERLSG